MVGLTKISMNYRTLAAHLQLFIDNQKNIANRYNGEDDRAYEESDKARELVEMAQPLLDELKELIQKAGKE